MNRLSAFYLLILCWVLAPPQEVSADEPAQEFLDALRAREDFDMALDYLEMAAADPAIPSTFKERVLYERGLTLAQRAKKQKDPVLREKWLSEGERTLKQFLSERKDSPVAVDARSQLGNVLVQKARLWIKNAEAETGETKGLLYAESRGVYAQAQAAFEKLEEDAREQLKKYPANLSETDDPRKFEERERVRMNYLQSRLLVAATAEEVAETHPSGSPEQTRILVETAGRYEKIYQDYKTRLAGLYGRMFQARCHQKLGQHKEAIVLLTELLTYPDAPEALHKFKVKTVSLAIDSWMEQKQYQEILDKAKPIVDAARDSEEKTPEFAEMRLKVLRAAKATEEQKKPK